MRHLRVPGTCIAVLAAVLSACGGGDGPSPLARTSQPAASAPEAGPTPFISEVAVSGKEFDKVSSVHFVVSPLAGTVSKPVSVTYSAAYLVRRGFLSPTSMQLPLFGLYAGTTNSVALTLTYTDGSSATLPLSVTTAAYDDPTYAAPQVIVPRAAGVSLGFDFIYMKAGVGSPVIVDTDGHPRWAAANVPGAASSTFADGAFILGSTTSPAISRLELDGTVTAAGTLETTDTLEFHHDIEAGKTGLLDNVNRMDGILQLESTAQEFTPDGKVLAQWKLDQILSDYMLSQGDDPTLFVRPPVDWFHMNTAIYDPADDSVIVSSRENFVIKLDYATGAIKWIFGDPTKYWYTFPSLRARSLTLVGDGLVPIGQHSITIAPDGDLLLFNNGLASGNQPQGAPAGQSRAYSAVSSYRLDETAMTAVEAWHFDYDQSVSAPFCSSVQQLPDGSLLIDYATTENATAARIVGTDASHRVAFDYRYPSTPCGTAWNSQPIALDALTLD
jgi:hypothetical protein